MKDPKRQGSRRRGFKGSSEEILKAFLYPTRRGEIPLWKRKAVKKLLSNH
jgi:hypothetical protein